MKKEVAVKQSDEAPVQVEVLAQAIIRLDESAKKLLNSGLNQRAIVTLLFDMMPQKSGYSGGGKLVNKAGIAAVLDNLQILRKTYCTK